MRIAAIADLHIKTDSFGLARELLSGVEEQADVLVLAGDLTNIGLPEEMEVLLGDLAGFSIPIIGVIGNHDHENGKTEVLLEMMQEAGICVLECTSCQIGDVGFVGTKGFCGGYGRWCVSTFGEQALKSFVQESIDEATLLDEALAGLEVERKLAIMHYSPTRDTLKGEAEEIYPFLGTSRLAEVLDKYKVDAVVHGHAHSGSPKGRTQGGVVVYNVSRFVQTSFGQRPYRILEL
ncbi:MAG: Calcineurin-like phosphoesterase superfamily domain protein [Syntrophorhabdaceae bacterium PtaU1.Bin034]|nr:MAG: Calcineurin-like phosphoesterase superfamily domain protein [Syntrophorhabdaceae bacterium PtaU1.Bin034]